MIRCEIDFHETLRFYYGKFKNATFREFFAETLCFCSKEADTVADPRRQR
jgi:hypothetical protein